MAEFFNKSITLLSGERAAVTGNYFDIFRARSLSVSIRATGIEGSNSSVTLYKESPFNDGGDIPFYKQTFSANAYYSTGLSSHLPISRIKAISDDGGTTGYFWVAVNHSN